MNFLGSVFSFLGLFLIAGFASAQSSNNTRDLLLQRFRVQAMKQIQLAQGEVSSRVRLRDLQVQDENFRWGILFSDAYFAEVAEIYLRWQNVGPEMVDFLFWEAQEKIDSSRAPQRFFFVYLQAFAELSRTAGSEFQISFLRFLIRGEEHFNKTLCCGDWLGRFNERLRRDSLRRVWNYGLASGEDQVLNALAEISFPESEISLHVGRSEIRDQFFRLKSQNDARYPRVHSVFAARWKEKFLALPAEQVGRMVVALDLLRSSGVDDAWLREFLFTNLRRAGMYSTRALVMALASMPNLGRPEIEAILSSIQNLGSSATAADLLAAASLEILTHSPSEQEVFAALLLEKNRELLRDNEEAAFFVFASFAVLPTLSSRVQSTFEGLLQEPLSSRWRLGLSLALGACATCAPKLDHHLALLMNTVSTREWLRQRTHFILSQQYHNNPIFLELLADPRSNMNRLRDIVIDSFLSTINR